jgi:hypothetical protein
MQRTIFSLSRIVSSTSNRDIHKAIVLASKHNQGYEENTNSRYMRILAVGGFALTSIESIDNADNDTSGEDQTEFSAGIKRKHSGNLE